MNKIHKNHTLCRGFKFIKKARKAGQYRVLSGNKARASNISLLAVLSRTRRRLNQLEKKKKARTGNKKKAILENSRIILENNGTCLRNKKALLGNKRSLLENERATSGNKTAFLENKREILE